MRASVQQGWNGEAAGHCPQLPDRPGKRLVGPRIVVSHGHGLGPTCSGQYNAVRFLLAPAPVVDRHAGTTAMDVHALDGMGHEQSVMQLSPKRIAAQARQREELFHNAGVIPQNALPLACIDFDNLIPKEKGEHVQALERSLKSDAAAIRLEPPGLLRQGQERQIADFDSRIDHPTSPRRVEDVLFAAPASHALSD